MSVGAIPNKEVATRGQNAARETEVAVKSIQDHHPRLSAGCCDYVRQELFGKGSLSSFSVEVPGHPHGHAGSQVQGNRRPRPKDAGLQIAQRFQQPLDVFDCLAVDAEDFVPLPACRKRKRVDSRLFGQELPQPLSPFLEQLLAERQRKVSQLVESRTYCDLQGIRFLPALEGLAATATVLGQRFGNKAGQSAEFEDLFV